MKYLIIAIALLMFGCNDISQEQLDTIEAQNRQILIKLKTILEHNKINNKYLYIEPKGHANIRARATEDLDVIEFEYKGNKFARFSMQGAGRGFAIPLGCGDSSSTTEPTTNGKYNVTFN